MSRIIPVFLLAVMAIVTPVYAEEEPLTDITGYNDYMLGMSITDVALEKFNGPNKLVYMDYYFRYVDFQSSGIKTKYRLVLSFTDDSLTNVWLQFYDLNQNFKTPLGIQEFARNLSEEFTGIYNVALMAEYFVYDDSPNESPRLFKWLKDHDGDNLVFHWAGQAIGIMYFSPDHNFPDF